MRCSAARRRGRTACSAIELEDFARSRAGVRAEHRGRCAPGCSTPPARASRSSTSAPRFLSRDRYVPAGADRAPRAAAGRPPARALRRAPALRSGAPRRPTITRGSNHLRFVLPAGVAAAEHRRAARPTSSTSTWFSCGRRCSLLLGPDETLTAGIEDTARDFEQETGALLARLDAAPGGAARVAGRGDPRGDHAEAVAVRGHRRDRRGHDHQHPRGAEQPAQLGLPLLLAARRLLRRARAQQPVRSRHDGGLPALAQQRRAQRRAAGTSSRCTASAWSRRCPSASCRRCPATAAWGRCGWATRRRSTSSTTCTATSSWARRRPSTTTGCSAAPTCASSPTWRRWASRPCASTTSPTPACGSCARARACTPRRR